MVTKTLIRSVIFFFLSTIFSFLLLGLIVFALVYFEISPVGTFITVVKGNFTTDFFITPKYVASSNLTYDAFERILHSAVSFLFWYLLPFVCFIEGIVFGLMVKSKHEWYSCLFGIMPMMGFIFVKDFTYHDILVVLLCFGMAAFGSLLILTKKWGHFPFSGVKKRKM